MRKLAIQLSVKIFKTRNVSFDFPLRIFVSAHVLITEITAPGMFTNLCLVLLLLLPARFSSEISLSIIGKKLKRSPGKA